MLSHCANSRCSKPFLRLRQGKLFLVEAEFVAKSGELKAQPVPFMRQHPRCVERYWLCDQCAEVWTLVHERGRGIMLVALPRQMVGAGVTNGAEYRESA
jgi:hypothetical protein